MYTDGYMRAIYVALMRTHLNKRKVELPYIHAETLKLPCKELTCMLSCLNDVTKSTVIHE